MRFPDSLRCLRQRNLQLFFAGQTVSLVGTWMQSVALSWLVWRLTHSNAALGWVTLLGQFPVFIFGTMGGAVADRFPRRKVLFITQTLATLQAVALAAVTLSGAARPAYVYALAAVLGVVNAFDIPVRQSLIADMAGEDIGNAIALNSSIVNGARMVGPAVAGYVVAAVGEGLCFLGNAVSYLAILYGLTRMVFPPEPPRVRQSGQLREGLRYAATTPHVRSLLLLLSIISVFGVSYMTLMPVLADHVIADRRLGRGATLLGNLLAASGLGALLAATSLLRLHGLAGLGRRVAWGSTIFSLGLLVTASSTSSLVSATALLFVGAGFMLQLASTNTLLQTLAPRELRGRVMGLFSMFFVGVSPLGALGAGYFADHIGAPTTLFVGASVALAASLVFHTALPGLRRIVQRDYPESFAAQIE